MPEVPQTTDDVILPGVSLSKKLDEMTDATTKGFARIEAKLDQKADQKDIEHLRTDVQDLRRTTNTRISALEQRNHDAELEKKTIESHKEQRGLTRKAKLGILSGVAVGGGTLAMAIAAFVH